MLKNFVALLLWAVMARLARIALLVAVLGGGFGYALTDIRSVSELRRGIDDARDAFRSVSAALER